MFRILFIFFLFIASVWLGIYLQQDPGYVLIALSQWTVETTLLIAIIGLLAIFFAIYLITSVLFKMARIPTTFRGWLARRRLQRARTKTRQGLIEFSEGYWKKAKINLIKALPETDAPLLNYLTAARAAQEMGDYKQRDNYLREAQQSMPEAKIAVELTQAQLQLANQQWEQALATLKHLQDLAPNHPYVLKLLMQLYKQVKDWPQLISLLPELQKNKVITGNEYKGLQQYAYLQIMHDLTRQKQFDALKKRYHSLPGFLIYNPEIVAVYSRYLIFTKQYSEAERLLRRTLGKQFNEELACIYGQINDKGAKLNFAESLLKDHPHSSALLLCLGRLCESKNLWGKARSYFERSVAHAPSPEAYFELGQLLQKLNDQASACIAYQKGLALVTQKIES